MCGTVANTKLTVKGGFGNAVSRELTGFFPLINWTFPSSTSK